MVRWEVRLRHNQVTGADRFWMALRQTDCPSTITPGQGEDSGSLAMLPGQLISWRRSGEPRLRILEILADLYRTEPLVGVVSCLLRTGQERISREVCSGGIERVDCTGLDRARFAGVIFLRTPLFTSPQHCKLEQRATAGFQLKQRG